jgi:hypothetical protein
MDGESDREKRKENNTDKTLTGQKVEEKRNSIFAILILA